MSNYWKQIRGDAVRKRTQKAKREEIMGSHAATLQDMREFQTKAKAAVTKGDSVEKAKGREAIKRVGEYKRRELDPGFYKGNPKTLIEERDNPRPKAEYRKGGKTSCRKR